MLSDSSRNNATLTHADCDDNDAAEQKPEAPDRFAVHHKVACNGADQTQCGHDTRGGESVGPVQRTAGLGLALVGHTLTS